MGQTLNENTTGLIPMMAAGIGFEFAEGTNVDEIKEFCKRNGVNEEAALAVPAGSTIFVYEDEQGHKCSVAMPEVMARLVMVALEMRLGAQPEFLNLE